MLTRIGLFLSVVIPVGASSADAQVLQYKPTGDTTQFLSQNHYFMYFVSGADTIGEPVITMMAESHYAEQVGTGLDIWVQLADSSGRQVFTQNIYGITAAGRVRSVDGVPVGAEPAQRVDLLPHLPSDGQIAVGREWVDSLSVTGEATYGDTWYHAERRYRVQSLADSLGTTVAMLVAEGAVQLRQGGWQDSTQALVWWQEVDGVVQDTVWIDVVRGQLIETVTSMELHGTGGAGPKGSTAGVPSGLRSVTRRLRLSKT